MQLRAALRAPLGRVPSVQAVVTIFVVVAAGFFVLLQLQPGLIATSTTAAGGDMGAHVWAPAYLRDHLLPHGRITGWAPDWYLGFPALHYYFPLPSILIVVLDVVLPYGVAFKVVAVTGLVLLPAACASLAHNLRLQFPAPPLLAASAVPFVFDRFHTIWGGNAPATLAGEFSFSIGLAAALFFLAALARALETGRGRVLAGTLLGVTALCHLLPAGFAVACAGALLLLRRPDRARWRIVVTSGLLGFAVAAFWFVPFIARIAYSNDMGWERTFAYLENLFPFLRHDDQAPAAATAHLKLIFPMAAVGLVLGIARRRRGAVALTAMAAIAGVGFRVVPAGPIWNARLLPFWYLSAYLLAGLAVSEIVILLRDAFADKEPDRSDLPIAPAEWGHPEPEPLPRRVGPGASTVVAALAGLVGVIVLTGIPLGVFARGRIDLPGSAYIPFLRLPGSDNSNFVPAWATWNFSGYERKPDYPEYRELITTMKEIGHSTGCGRAMWEYEPELNRYGTPMAPMLLPYFTDGCIGSMEGLFFESSATVPYHFLNQSELSRTPSRAMRDLPYRDLNVDAGIEHLKLLGVRYYLALTPEAQAAAVDNPDLRLLATTSPYSVTYTDGVKSRFWQIFEVKDTAIVAPLSYEPVVVDGIKGFGEKKSWLRVAVDWYQDPSRWEIPLADDGPAEWRRVPSASTTPPQTPVREARVTNVRADGDEISFDVDRPGTPVVVRASYFPNWKVTGADGPWRITPNLMVVIPKTTHVRLHYGWTPVDLLAWAITLIGVALAARMVRKGPVKLPAPPPPPPEDYIDPFVADRATRTGAHDEVFTGASASP